MTGFHRVITSLHLRILLRFLTTQVGQHDGSGRVIVSTNVSGEQCFERVDDLAGSFVICMRMIPSLTSLSAASVEMANVWPLVLTGNFSPLCLFLYIRKSDFIFHPICSCLVIARLWQIKIFCSYLISY